MEFVNDNWTKHKIWSNKSFATILAIFFLLFAKSSAAQQIYDLHQCKELLLSQNYDIQIAKEESGSSTAIRKSVYTQFLPQFSFTGSYMRTDKKFNLLSEDMFAPVVPYLAVDYENWELKLEELKNNPGLAAITFAIDPSTNQPYYDADGNPVFRYYTYLPKEEFEMGSKNIYLLNLGMMQPIYTGGKIKHSYAISKETEKISYAQYDLSIQKAIYKMEKDFWSHISIQQKLLLAQQYQRMLEQILSDLENIRDEGFILENKVMQAKVKLNEAKLMVLKAENGLELSKMNLCQQLGISYSEEIIFSEKIMIENTEAEVLKSAKDSALNNRKELEMLDAAVNIAESSKKLAASRFFPNIGLTANYFWSNPNPYNGFKEEFGGNWNVGVGCNIPLWHWGDRMHTHTAAQHKLKVAELQKEQTTALIELQTNQAIFQMQEAGSKLRFCEIAVKEAEKNLELAENTYAEGIISLTDLLQAQTSWMNARTELVEAQTQYKIQEAYLEMVKGTIH